MPDVINWLHLSDLHLGLDGDAWLWPKVKHDLFVDLERMLARNGAIDLVFFTGDFVQRGNEAEYAQLNHLLQELWDVLGKGGSTPFLCAVPGNHDIVRPDPGSSVLKAMTSLWWEDQSVRDHFWRDPNADTRALVATALENYMRWLDSVPVPLLRDTEGCIPGDFSATFNKGSVSLGIVGLNTTFLQVAAGNFLGKLDVHMSQIARVCDGDAEGWVRARTAAVLLTHHAPDWFDPRGLRRFQDEIYPPGRFVGHFCGHLHEANVIDAFEGGTGARRLRQASSLFGLEGWGDAQVQKRTHGYTAGQYSFDGTALTEKLWPRIAVRVRGGGYHLTADASLRPEEDGSLSRVFESPGTAEDPTGKPEPTPEPVGEEFQLLTAPPGEADALRMVVSCPRFIEQPGPQHRGVRLDELSAFEHALRSDRCVWLVADWGTGRNEFIATALERFRKATVALEAFHLRCDEASRVTAFESLFPQQFGHPIQKFCNIIAQLPNAFLLLDDLHPELLQNEERPRFERLIGAILDYCPALKIVITTRQRPGISEYDSVALQPLELPDTRTYITAHRDAPVSGVDAETIEAIHRHSDGLPMHIDRLLKAMKVASLSTVIEAELEGSLPAESLDGSDAAALMSAVNRLASSETTKSKRSLKLLKVLSMLPYGETLEVLRHFLPAEPFFLENAVELNELSLLDVVPLQPGVTGKKSERDLAKVLRVPRQVRDYVQTLLNEAEREQIVGYGLERYFGRGWREGRAKVRAQDLAYRDFIGGGAGNEAALVHQYLLQCRNKGDQRGVGQAAAMSLTFAHHLYDLDRYRDASLVTEPLLDMVPKREHAALWARLVAIHGRAVRMLDGRKDEALTYLNEALEAGSTFLSKDEQASIWLGIALVHDFQGDAEAAVDAANKVVELTSKKDAKYVHAQAIIAVATLSVADARKRLAELEDSARASGKTKLANILALQLADLSGSDREKTKLADRVIDSRTPGYNRTRAIILKAGAILENPGKSVRPGEVQILTTAYSYLYSQRFSSLFDRCHDALWSVFEADGDTGSLMRLFRHSSFLWRIRGEDAKEAEYLSKLRAQQVAEANAAAAGWIIELRYFWHRLRVRVLPGPEAGDSLTSP
ncbi:MAG TPA: metallophosphoesterase [Phycisphaerales bacterium]|nr:metallophosphoesterase [Phycisphaerales bacterium]